MIAAPLHAIITFGYNAGTNVLSVNGNANADQYTLTNDLTKYYFSSDSTATFGNDATLNASGVTSPPRQTVPSVPASTNVAFDNTVLLLYNGGSGSDFWLDRNISFVGLNGSGASGNRISSYPFGASDYTITISGLPTNTTYSFAGRIINGGLGSLALTMNQTNSVQILTGTNTYNGPTTVLNGTLIVNGSLNAGSAVTIGGGTLRGTGTVGNVSVTGGTLAPGGSATTGGTLNTGNLTLNASSTFALIFESATVFSAANVVGTVSLGNSALTATFANGYTPAAGTVFRIITNDGTDSISGTFLGRAEGATVTLGGKPFSISYTGGTGNDVVLTALATSHTIGGTTSGLGAGKSVVLQNNGGDNLTVNSNTAFTFATPVNDGSNYAVTVLTQPVGQTCVVTNGTGTATANVTNVAVSCTTNTYTVGGTASGLGAGKSVVLQNNAGDNLTVNSNASFTFATAINHGGAYAVTVLTQPVGQMCAVSNGSGTATANVTNVSVSCTTNTYTIGGTASGLGVGKSVVLQNNAGDNLTVNSNASFTFATAISDGGAYAVTVLTQPAGQTCAVSNGSGAATANVNNVSISCIDTTSTGSTPGGQVIAAVTGGTCLGYQSGSTVFTAPVSPPAGSVFPYGVVGLTAVSCGAGGTVTVTTTYPNNLPPNIRYWKSINGSWVDWTSQVTISGATILLTLTDGAYGDTNLNVGDISHLGGPAYVLSEASTSVPTLSTWGLLLLSGFIVVGAIAFMRRRRA